MKHIISLYGAHDVGKTSTLRMLIELIAAEQGLTIDMGKYDCKKTFTIDGKTVCICTAGDNKEEIWSATDYLTNRYDPCLDDVKDKVYTRDIFKRD